jgi:arylformamidase
MRMGWSPKLIDLTRPLTNEAVVALAGKFAEPGSPYSGLELSYLRNWDTENGMVCKWTLNDHLGTHLDAPIHIVPGTPSVDQIDITRVVGEAVVVDCAFANGRGITAEDFDRAAPSVQAGDIVLIYSAERPAKGVEDYPRDQTYMTPSGAQWLVDHRINAVGVEAYSFENLYDGIFVHEWYSKTTPQPHWPAHAICLRQNIYIIEGLINLQGIVGKRVRFCALPLPVPGSSGSPVRAVAWEE